MCDLAHLIPLHTCTTLRTTHLVLGLNRHDWFIPLLLSLPPSTHSLVVEFVYPSDTSCTAEEEEGPEPLIDQWSDVDDALCRLPELESLTFVSQLGSFSEEEMRSIRRAVPRLDSDGRGVVRFGGEGEGVHTEINAFLFD